MYGHNTCKPMKKLTTAILCTMSLIGLWSCDKTEGNTDRPADYPQTGPVADGYVSVDGETILTVPFAYCTTMSSDDDGGVAYTRIQNIYLYDKSMFLLPARPDENSAKAQLRLYDTFDYNTGRVVSERIDILLPQEPFDAMNLSIATADGKTTASEPIEEVVELARIDGERHIYEPWQNTEYGFWSEYSDIDLTVHLRLKGGQTLKIVCTGQMLISTLL